MVKGYENFPSADDKRLILVADDEMINREMLGEMLKDEYEILFACDGAETLEVMKQYKDRLSLVLLDILMPVMSGLEVLKAVKDDAELSRIPVIVTTAEKETEIESLNLGAVDFIPKPYPAVGVIRARVLRIIELSEDRETIQSTERDELTGLYNKDYFYRYARQYDQHHTETETDAIIVNVNHFHMINERYGKSYGDGVLRRIGENLRAIVNTAGGMVCRREADTFMIYCPHREDYRLILENASVKLAGEETAENRVRLRMGVYANTDKSIDIERRFDRAKMASDTVKGSFSKQIGFYDNKIHEQQIFAEQLIEDFPAAIAEKQFKVFFQPKFDIRPDTPILTSAEALVRWVHPKLGMISPGVFIPLFEENGLIQILDKYVWEETARRIREWKDRLGCSVPISVNVSRIDMFDPKLPDTFKKLLDDYNLTGHDMLLEVTESAYTENSDQIIDMVKSLRDMGFQIEMDDFGTGYSSLNMISTLPIDALKLDMSFIRDAFREGGNTHMLEIIIEIATYLSVPVIAEGVETKEQLQALKSLGCDIVQGYYFSKPLPAEEFEAFIIRKREADLAALEKPAEGTAKFTAQDRDEQDHFVKREMLKMADESPAETEPSNGAENIKERATIKLKAASIFTVILAFIIAAALMITDIAVARGYGRMAEASDSYIAAELAAADMESGSDYLTDRVRCFVVTGDIKYLKEFYEEIEVTKRRDKAVQTLKTLMGGENNSAYESLNTALTLSNELIGTENRAIRLTVEAGDYSQEDIPSDILAVKLSDEDMSLSAEAMRAKAQTLVYDGNYMQYKERIKENVNACTQSLIGSSSTEFDRASRNLSFLVNLQTVITVIFLLIVLGIVLMITLMVRKPLTKMVEKMQNKEIIPPTGAEELRFVTRTYNQILRENDRANEKLSHMASHDPLTGLFNRGAYDLLMEGVDTEHMALLLIDVCNFKNVNDKYGQAAGDKVLKRVADVLRNSFRSVDIICRFGGDEFAVVMTRVGSDMQPFIQNKIIRISDTLRHSVEDIPPVELNIGVAFSDCKNPKGDIFRDADSALHSAKQDSEKCYAVYE